jgi:energy-coupling factor transport system permease protein
LRAIPLFLAASLFTSMTPESEISHGLEDILEPLAVIGIKPRRIALAVTAAFRFVPIVAGEIESILRAQSCRGADFSARSRGVLGMARAWLPLFVPVMVGSLEKAQALALAMEARGYRESGRSRYRDYPRRKGEIALRILLVGAAVAGIAVDRLFVF